MKKLLILLTVLAIAATPALAGTHVEKSKAHKQATKHVAVKHQKKQLKKKLAKRNLKKHKVAV